MFATCNNHKDQKKRLLFRRKVLFSPTALSGTLVSDRRCKSVNPSSTSAELLDGCPCEASCTRDGLDSEIRAETSNEEIMPENEPMASAGLLR